MVQRSTQLTVLALLLLLLLFLLLYTGESGIFDIYASQWEWPTHTTDHTPQPLDLSGDYGKILILSDPHIQCSYDQFEPWLFRWDSDQYVRRAFSRLVQRLQPELVVVLGDLFAEGYKASLVDWEDYLQVHSASVTERMEEDFTREAMWFPSFCLPPSHPSLIH